MGRVISSLAFEVADQKPLVADPALAAMTAMMVACRMMAADRMSTADRMSIVDRVLIADQMPTGQRSHLRPVRPYSTPSGPDSAELIVQKRNSDQHPAASSGLESAELIAQKNPDQLPAASSDLESAGLIAGKKNSDQHRSCRHWISVMLVLTATPLKVLPVAYAFAPFGTTPFLVLCLQCSLAVAWVALDMGRCSAFGDDAFCSDNDVGVRDVVHSYAACVCTSYGGGGDVFDGPL